MGRVGRVWEDEFEDGGVYEGTVGAHEQCVGRGEGGYSGVGGYEVFPEGIWGLLSIRGEGHG